MILASAITRKRIKHVKNHLKIDTIDYMQVIGVDEQGGYIDLSKKNVGPEDKDEHKSTTTNPNLST